MLLDTCVDSCDGEPHCERGPTSFGFSEKSFNPHLPISQQKLLGALLVKLLHVRTHARQHASMLVHDQHVWLNSCNFHTQVDRMSSKGTWARHPVLGTTELSMCSMWDNIGDCTKTNCTWSPKTQDFEFLVSPKYLLHIIICIQDDYMANLHFNYSSKLHNISCPTTLLPSFAVVDAPAQKLQLFHWGTVITQFPLASRWGYNHDSAIHIVNTVSVNCPVILLHSWKLATFFLGLFHSLTFWARIQIVCICIIYKYKFCMCIRN